MGNSLYKEKIAPTLVLSLICLIVTTILVVTNTMTLPIIEAITKKNADIARAEVLPEGDAFVAYSGELNEGVLEYYSSENGAGVAITSTAKSFGGLLTVMIGIDAEGKITGVKVTEHKDTPGLGTKAMTVEYLSGYNGLTELAGGNIKKDPAVDYIVGASVSSNGVYASVCGALKQYKDLGGVQ